MVVAGRLDDAARQFNRAAEAHPDDYRSHCLLVMVYRSLDRPDLRRAAAEEGLARAERELGRNPGNALAACLGAQMLVALDQPERAREWLSLALVVEPDDYWTLYNVACAHSLLGDLDLAATLLERAMSVVNPAAASWWKNDSDLDPLHDHPGFIALLNRIEAAA